MPHFQEDWEADFGVGLVLYIHNISIGVSIITVRTVNVLRTKQMRFKVF